MVEIVCQIAAHGSYGDVIECVVRSGGMVLGLFLLTGRNASHGLIE
jgi:hypothetical protein